VQEGDHSENQLHGLFELEGTVEHNKFQVYAARCLVGENRSRILSNYAAAMANRALANQNTADIFKNRTTILSGMQAEGIVEENFKQSMLNEGLCDYLEHRSKMNGRVATTNHELSKINSALIEVKSAIMQCNAEVAAFNSKHVEINSRLLDGEVTLETATAQDNAERIRATGSRMVKNWYSVKANEESFSTLLELVTSNRERLVVNDATIHKRREKISYTQNKICRNRDSLKNRLTVLCMHAHASITNYLHSCYQ
jgi:hypothetical protein